MTILKEFLSSSVQRIIFSFFRSDIRKIRKLKNFRIFLLYEHYTIVENQNKAFGKVSPPVNPATLPYGRRR